MHQNKNPQQSPWQRRRQQRRQQDEQLATERKQALDASAPRLRNLFIFVQVFLLYVVVSIFGVDDRDLLNPDSTVRVPLLNIGLPTFYFFLLAPVLIALLHINLLLHHQAYQDKLRHWRDGAPKAQLDQLAPNFFDIAFLTEDRWQRQLVRASLWFLLYFWPPAALCLALFWFADYQNPWVTLEHFALLIISYGASIYFSWRQDHFRQEIKVLLLWALTLLLGFVLLIGGYLAVSFWVFAISNPLLMLAYITLLIIGGGIGVHLPWSKICAGNKLQNISRWLQGLILSALPLVGTYLVALVISLTWVSYERSNPWFESNLLYQPNIDTPSFIYQDLDASTIDLASAYETNATNAELIKNYSQPLDLRERSLRYADLSYSFLPRVRLASADLAGAYLRQASLQDAELIFTQLPGASLREAQLQGARLGFARLQGASLVLARLQGADLWAAQLQDANLSEARLQGADLHEAQLQGAYLWVAKLQEANLSSAQLQDTNLSFARLQGADLQEAQLQGAYLLGAELQDADLSLAQLQGANLIGAQLQDANLSEARLQGADLHEAQLQGAYLWVAKLQEANLSSAQLQDTNLSFARLQGADLHEAQLQGAYLLGAELQDADLSLAQLQGANLIGAQLQGASLSSAQLQAADLLIVQLQAADLSLAQLQGAILIGAQLQGADLIGAQLQGADLRLAQLQGAELIFAQLQGAYLIGAQLQGANLGSAQLRGAYLWKAQLQGAWSDFSRVSDLNWTDNDRANLLLLRGFASDLSELSKQSLPSAKAESIIAELEEVKQLDGLSDDHQGSIDAAIRRIRAAVGKPWTLEGSGAITGVLTQEMIDEILEQWDD